MLDGPLFGLLRVSLVTALQYRSNFLVEMIVSAGTALMGLIPLVFVFDHAASIGGWSFHEALLVTAFFLVLSGLVGAFVAPNLNAVVEGVRRGNFDYLLIRPVDAQLLASAQKVAPAKLWELVAGVGVGLYAFRVLPAPTLGGALGALGLLLAGLAAMYSVWLGVICLSFRFVRVDNLSYLLTAITDAGRWPISVYKGFARVALTVVVPVALTTSFPAMALLGRMDGLLAAQALVIAAGALAISRALWKRALRHYTSASS